MAEIKTDRWTLADMCTHPKRLMNIKWQTFHGVSSSRATW